MEAIQILNMLIGEALLGTEPELAHVDLLIGSKDGPVGKAFAQGLTTLSAGHTPLLAVIRPNLPPKPHTLIVPKVTVQNMEQAAKIFGPAQYAVAKAVADAVEEGIFPDNVDLDKIVIIASIFIHPEANDHRRIYNYNYGATKLALKRALTNYPPIEKVIYDKDRAKHPLTFKIPRLWRPPYLQIALDIPSIRRTKEIIRLAPKSDRLILEAGTPLIKKYGVRVIRELREVAPDVFIIADLKTLDVGKVEVDLAYEETADAVVCSGLATVDTLNKFIYEAKRLGIYAIVDLMNVTNILENLKSLDDLPDVLIFHRGIDTEDSGGKTRWDLIKEVKQEFIDSKFLVAVAGGIRPANTKDALEKGADIIIVGRYITQARDVEKSVRDFLKTIGVEEPAIDHYRVHTEDG